MSIRKIQITQLQVDGMTGWPRNTYELGDSLDRQPAGEGGGSKKIKFHTMFQVFVAYSSEEMCCFLCNTSQSI